MIVRLRLLRPILHITSILAVFYLAYIIRLQTDLIPGIQLRIPPIIVSETMIYAAISAVLFVALGFIKNMYGLYKPVQKYYRTLGKVRLYRIVIITFIAYFGGGIVFIGGISRIIIAFAVVMSLLVISIIDYVLNTGEKWAKNRNDKKVLIITNDSEQANNILNKMNISKDEAHIIIPSQRQDHKNSDRYHTTIALGQFEKHLLQDMMDTIRLTDARFFHIAESIFLEDIIYTPEAIGNIVALEYKPSKLDGRSTVLKRIFDIIASAVAIILLSPIMLIIAILIKIDSSGPVIYTQKRVGRYGQLFTFLKFRSMYTHLSTGDKFGGTAAEQIYDKLIHSAANTRDKIMPKIADDPRVTKIGKFLRKTSLDELPQLFSIFIGTMSVVGPRPHLPREVDQYENRQRRLLSIKPGITGYAQTFGRDTLSFTDEAKLDLYYIQNWSVLLDIYVIIMTIKVIFSGR